MTTNQQRYDNDDGTDDARELAQEYVSERIEELCEAHPGCRDKFLCGTHLDGLDEPQDCRYYADAVTARMKAMKEDAL